MRVAILRIGEVERDVLKKIRNELSETYIETDCMILENMMSVPLGAYDEKRLQFRSSIILEKIGKHVMQSQVDHILGVTEVDLYVPQLNFVFGEARCPGKVAVVSLFRLKPEFYGHPADPELFSNRSVKEAVHEIGHTMGLSHCQNPQCVMFFSNSIEETDRKGKTFCGKCHSKVAKLLAR